MRAFVFRIGRDKCWMWKNMYACCSFMLIVAVTWCFDVIRVACPKRAFKWTYFGSYSLLLRDAKICIFYSSRFVPDENQIII